MFNRFLLVSFFSGVILTMNACQSTPSVNQATTPVSGDPQTLLARAEQSSDPREQINLRLSAARVFLENDQFAAALSVLLPMQSPSPALASPALPAPSQQMDTQPPPQTRSGRPLAPVSQPAQTQQHTLLMRDPDLRGQYARLLARAQLGAGDYRAAQSALTLLNDMLPEDYLLVADICRALQDYGCSADGYIQASIALGMDHPELPPDVNEIIWQSLNRAQKGPAVYTHRYHHAWWLLQQQIRTAGSIPAQKIAWQAWQKRYPSHPARLQPPSTLLRLNDYQAPSIALFLPLSGSLGGAGTAVRDGLISAYLSEQGDNKPSIRIYDTASGDIAGLWEQALLDGADVTVGPLLKDNAERFSQITQFASQPRLLLNYIDAAAAGVDRQPPPVAPGGVPLSTATTNKIFQFGIAIEDEARALANHVLLDGHEKLMVVYGNRRWAQRARQEYLEQWPYPATEAAFVDIKGLTEAVGEAMQVAASEERKTEIANILGEPLEFLPRGRRDMDAVVALTSQVEARALIPALRFHFASDLPIYATSQVARGDNLAELSGFKLTEMPLFSEPTEEQAALFDAFNLDTNRQAELYALGFDAYRLATWLPLLEPAGQLALPAASGYLWLDGEGRFKRDLNLSQIDKNGLQSPAGQ